MQGRLEHQIREEKYTGSLLEGLPLFVSEFYLYMKTSGATPKSCRDYVIKIRKFFSWVKENCEQDDIKAIQSIDILKYMKSRETMTDGSGNIVFTSHSLRCATYSCLKTFFEFMYINNHIEENPMENMKRPKGKQDNVKRIRLDEKQIKTLIKILNKGFGSDRERKLQQTWRERDIAIVQLLLCTGMRCAALSEINMEDVDLENSTVSTIDKGEVLYDYILPESVCKILEAWIKKRQELLDVKRAESDALFISVQRKRMGEAAISNVVKKFTEAATGTAMSPHKFRRTYAQQLFEAGCDLFTVQKALKHRSVNTTQQIYVEDDGRSKHIAANIMDKYGKQSLKD